jgi:hypothetical protein
LSINRYRKLWKELDETNPFVTIPPFLVLDFSPTKATLMRTCDEVRIGLCDQVHGLAIERINVTKAIERHQQTTGAAQVVANGLPQEPGNSRYTQYIDFLHLLALR